MYIWGDLSRHMVTHTGEGPNKWEECDNAFTRPSVLKWHMITHVREKPYKCEAYGNKKSQSQVAWKLISELKSWITVRNVILKFIIFPV